jgi:hypothetical protein
MPTSKAISRNIQNFWWIYNIMMISFGSTTLSLIRGFQISKLNWLIGLVKDAIWADSLHFQYLLLTFNFQNPSFIPHYPMILCVGMLGKCLLFYKTLFEIMSTFMEIHGYRSAYFTSLASATFTAKVINTLCCLLQVSFQPGFYEWTPKCVFSSENRPNVISILYAFELPWNTLLIWDMHRSQVVFFFPPMTTALWVYSEVNATLGGECSVENSV